MATEEPQTPEEQTDSHEDVAVGMTRVAFNDYCKRMATCGLAVQEIGNRSTAAEAKRWAKVFVEALALSITHGESVHIPGLGTFSVVFRQERAGVNPRTLEQMTIPARKAIHFSPSRALKEAVNG